MIRKATEHDIDAVEQGYTELLTHEKDNGSSSNWVLGVYPTRSVAEGSCAAGTLYVMEEEDGICASMILNQVQSEEYYGIAWEYPAGDDEVLVLHTLCIPPSKSRSRIRDKDGALCHRGGQADEVQGHAPGYVCG